MAVTYPVMQEPTSTYFYREPIAAGFVRPAVPPLVVAPLVRRRELSPRPAASCSSRSNVVPVTTAGAGARAASPTAAVSSSAPAGGAVSTTYSSIGGFRDASGTRPVPLRGSCSGGSCRSPSPPSVIAAPGSSRWNDRSGSPGVRSRLPHHSPEDSQISCLSIGRELNSVAVSPDGRRAVFGLQDHTLQIWDLEAQVVVTVLKGHKYWVNHVCWSLNGTLVASAGADKVAKIWNVKSGNCELTLQGHMLSVAAVAFADDSKRLATGSWDKTVCVWEVANSKSPVVDRPMTLKGHTDWVHSVAWAPGGRRIASASSDHSVRMWNAISGTIEQVLVGHLQTVSSVCFARNGVYLASGSLDRTVRVWDTEEGNLIARLEQENDEGAVHCIAFAQDSERIVAGCSDKSVKVWNLRTGEPDARYIAHEDAVFGIAVAPDARRIISCSHDKTARVWHMPTRVHRFQPPSSTPSTSRMLPGAGSISFVGTASNSFQDLHDRLQTTEDTNRKLRQQLSEAQTQIEEKNGRMRNIGSQEQQLSSYRDTINSLQAEKDRLEQSFKDMQRELKQLKSAPASASPGPRTNVVQLSGYRGAFAGPVVAMTLTPAGTRR